MTVTEALAHSWLSEFHVEEDEPDCPEVFQDWKDVEKLDNVEAIRAAIMREISEFRELVRSQSVEDEDEDDGEVDMGIAVDHESIEELIDEAELEGFNSVTWDMSKTSTDAAGSTQTGVLPPLADVEGVSPTMTPDLSQTTVTQADHSRQSSSSVLTFVSTSLPVPSSVPLPQSRRPSQRHGSTQRFPSSGPVHPSSVLGENGLPIPYQASASTSRKSSTSMHRRKASSFFFGGGMTSINPNPDKRPATTYGDLDSDPRVMSKSLTSVSRLPSGATGMNGMMEHGGGSGSHMGGRPKSRAPSLAAGEFGALRPIIRGLSAMDLNDLHERINRSDRSQSKDRRTSQGEHSVDGGQATRQDEEGDMTLTGEEGTVLMPVSPNDAPPSPVSPIPPS